MNRRSPTTVLAALAVTVVAFGAAAYLLAIDRPAHAQSKERPTAERTRGDRGASVVVAEPERRPLTRHLALPASLEAYESTDLFAKTSGYLETISVDIGSRVRKGDALIVIDVPEMHDELRQAEAVLESKRAKVKALTAEAEEAQSRIAIARAEVERYAAEFDLWKLTLERKRQLVEAEAIPPQDFDEVKSRFAVVEAQSRIAEAKVTGAQASRESVLADRMVAESDVAVEQARIARLKTLMEYATVRAPFDGVVTRRMVDPGAFVRSAADGGETPLLTVADDRRIRLRLEIPESDAADVKPGTAVTVRVRSLGDDSFEAAVVRTADALKPGTRTMRAEVDLDNADSRLSPGMYALAEVLLESKREAMMIPSKAVRVHGRDLFVLVADGSVARTMPISIGYDDGAWAEVTDGLGGGERVIVSASGVITDGSVVDAVVGGS